MIWVTPIGDTAADEAVRIINSRINLGVEAPKLLARSGIERAHFVEGGTDVQPAIHQDRRVFKRCTTHRLALGCEVTCGKRPSDGQPIHVCGSNLGGGRIAGPPGSPPYTGQSSSAAKAGAAPNTTQ